MFRGRAAQPRANKITAKKYENYCKQLHRSRLNNIKSSIDNSAPKRHNHLRQNLKREQLMEERYARIERENRILLDKMSSIMQGNHGIDNVNESLKFAKSMNNTRRKFELEKITLENQHILRRIQSREPTYNHLKWEEDRKQNEKYIQNISEFGGVREMAGSSSLVQLQNSEDDSFAMGMHNSFSQGALPRLDPEYERMARERSFNEQPGFPDQPLQRSGQLAPLG